MVSKTLFAQVLQTEITMPLWLDHCFQSVTFSTEAHTPDIDMRLHHEPVYGPEGYFLRWKPERAAEYISYLEQDTPAKQRLHRAIEHEDVEQTWYEFRTWLFDAALQTGMTTSGTHTRTRPVPRKAAWFDDTCQEKKQMLLEAVMRGEDTHLRDQLEREYKAQVQRCKRRFVNTKRDYFSQKLFAKDPAVHKMLKQPMSITPQITLILQFQSWNWSNVVTAFALVNECDQCLSIDVLCNGVREKVYSRCFEEVSQASYYRYTRPTLMCLRLCKTTGQG